MDFDKMLMLFDFYGEFYLESLLHGPFFRENKPT